MHLCIHSIRKLLTTVMSAYSLKCIIPVATTTAARPDDKEKKPVSPRGENASPGSQSAWERWHLTHLDSYHLRRWGFTCPQAQSKQENNKLIQTKHRENSANQEITSSHIIDCLFDAIDIVEE